MPNTRSAKKELRKAVKRTAANKAVKDAYKQAIKTVKKGLEAGNDVSKDLVLAQKKLDKAAKKGVIKKSTASRRLSRLSTAANKKKTASK